MKRLLSTIALFAAILALAACSGGSSGDGAGALSIPVSGAVEPESELGRYGGNMTLSAFAGPRTFNLVVAAETSSTDVVGGLFEPMVGRNAYTLQHEPRLAEALPEISPDGLVYTFRLREGLTWSDGQPLTADDVVFTLDVVYDPSTETIWREGLLVDVVRPDGSIDREPVRYRKLDDRTVEFTIPQPFAPAMDAFSFSVMPKHKLEAAYRAGRFNQTWGINTPVSELVSSGPWIITDFAPEQRVIYRPNPHFWERGVDGNPLPYLSSFTYLIVPDSNTTTLRFRNGDADVLTVPATDYPAIKRGEAEGDYTVINRGPGWGFNYLGFNMNPDAQIDPLLVELFSDVRFRQAVSHAVNRQRMVDDIFLGLAQPLYGPVTPANTAFFNPNAPRYEFDLDRARALLAEIGLADSNGDGILEYKGLPVRFNILTNTENELRKSMATIVSNDLRTIGLGAQFTPINFNELVRRLDSPPYEWEAVILGFTGGPDPHGGSNIWRSSGPSHQWRPRQETPATEWEAEIDRLWTAGAQEMDPERRREIYHRWQEIAGEQLPFIFTIVVEQQTAVRNHFGNLKPASLDRNGVLWNVEEIFDTRATGTAPTP